MAPRTTQRLIHELRRLIGRILASVRLHRIRTVLIAGSQVIVKSRRFGSGLLVPLGNLFLFLEGSNVEILSERAWLQWELAVDSATSVDRDFQSILGVCNQFRCLLSHKCSGRPLSDILVDEAFTLDQKLTAIKWATLALYQLHRQKADWGNGIWQSISHGDATANNVVISVESASTRWIDFDTRHLVRLPDVDRRADDLRALLFSCASHLKQSCFQRLVDEFMSTNPDALVVARLRERFLSDWSKLNTHQLAQAPLTWPLANSLSQAFLIIPSAD